jgi:hypothetical protein
MDQHEHEAAIAEPEPDQRQRQQRDRRQRIEHGGDGFEKISADPGRDCQDGEERGECYAGAIAHEQDL